jgi:hypothetical protein
VELDKKNPFLNIKRNRTGSDLSPTGLDQALLDTAVEEKATAAEGEEIVEEKVVATPWRRP